jgi:hypothetical protein
MKIRRSKSLLAVAVATGLVLAACGSDKKTESTSAPTTAAPTATTAATTAETTEASTAETTEATTGESTADSTEATTGDSTEATTDDSTSDSTGGTAASGDAVSLAGDCPDTVVIQTDWMPEAEHGFLYQMVGEGYEIDKDKAYVTGPLIDQNGNDTGVKIQIRSGGAAQQFASVSTIMYDNDDSFLGYVYTDEGIQNSATKPTVAIESGFDKNPQMIMWDPATYPDVTGIEDLGKEKVKIRYFGGAAYMDFFTSTGILSTDQVDGSYQGDPNLFITDEGKAAQQGFGSAEPYLYENEYQDWLKPVKYQYINDVGWTNYAESIATKPENITEYADCFKKLVPIIQHASVDYLDDPARTNAIILAAVEAFGTDFGWNYTEGTLNYGVDTIKKDGLVANGPDGVIGKFDTDRIADLITKAIPVYTAQDSPPKDGLTPEDIVTNEFLDESIGLK